IVGIKSAQRAPVRLGFVRWEISAAVVSVSGFVRLGRGAENVAFLARGDIEETGLRVKGWRHPVCRADCSGADSAPLRSWRAFFVGNWAALSILAATPGCLGVCAGGEQLASGAIQNVETSIAIGLRDQVLAAQIDRDGDLGGVPIVLVVLGELEMPVQLSCLCIKIELRVAVKIVVG